MRRALAAFAVIALCAALVWWRATRERPAESPPVRQIASPVAAAPVATRPSVAATPTGQMVRQIAAPARAAGRVVVRAAWGSGPGQLGRRKDPESAPEGPMSLIADRRGDVLVLDQINHRIQRWSPAGAPLPPIAINGDTGQDFALGKNGTVIVLDRLAEQNLQFYAADGRPLGEVALRGAGIPEGGGTTGLFTDEDGNAWVEREHGPLTRVATADGNSDPARPSLPGRPSRDGRDFLSGAIADRAAGTAIVRALDAAGQPLWQATVAFGAPLLYIVLLDSDAAGNVYVGAHVGHESTAPPYAIVDEQVIIAGLGPDGATRGALALPAAPSEEEAFREFTVGDDGTIYRMLRSEAGVVVEAYRL
jgi:hypothetical protein